MKSVTIILPIYNRAELLPRCLASLRAQTWSDWELVAVDDGSTDSSAQVFKELTSGDPRCRLLRHEVNGGAAAARNTAIAAATGEYLAFLDSDDEWLPEKLQKQLLLLGACGAEACGCEYWLCTGGVETVVRLPAPVTSWHESLHTECRLANGSTLVVRRACLESLGPLEAALRLYEDWDWLLRLTERFRYVVVPEPLARIHANPGGRPPELFAQSAELFLSRHDSAFRRIGKAHRGEVRGRHFEYVAANAFAARHFALGCRYTLRSFGAAPLRRPLHLGALLLAPLDWLLGTHLLQQAASAARNKLQPVA